MILKIYSVFDSAVQAYLQPFFAPTTGSAIRSLTEAANDVQNSFSKHAKDYTLHYLGDYDDASGVITPCSPQHIVAVNELINKA